ncbi:MAG: MBL fold metallo-hydrolase [Actinomycetia bacterium]|nr:MBL fold metallo-hydrolase [Actinomycetes bacterium]
MRLNLLGVRGSTPVSGQNFNRYGGHTSCVAVTASGDTRPTVALDAGTGLQNFTALMQGEPFGGTILLSHLHWDHMQGLPFFRAGDRDDSDVRMCVPAQDGLSGEQLLRQSMAPPAFPITPAGLRGSWKFAAIEPGAYQIESFTVTAAEVRHKGGRAFGYRVSDGFTDIAYLPDHVARGEITAGLESLVRGVDVLLHDAQFVEAERSLADAYGHSTIGDAVELAVSLDVGRLVLFHHSPVRTDDQLDALAADIDAPMPVDMACEGLVLDLG